MTKKVIALDIGNVCLTIHPERCFGALGYRSLREIPAELLFFAGERFERGEISEAEFLAGSWTNAMMDVSDGPALDARRFAAASKVRFALDPACFPARDGASAGEKLGDGEDYELIFTVPEAKGDALIAAWPFATWLAAVGKVLAGSGVTGPDGKELEDYGYRHFKKI